MLYYDYSAVAMALLLPRVLHCGVQSYAAFQHVPVAGSTLNSAVSAQWALESVKCSDQSLADWPILAKLNTTC